MIPLASANQVRNRLRSAGYGRIVLLGKVRTFAESVLLDCWALMKIGERTLSQMYLSLR